MKRLIQGQGNNSPNEYDRIFLARQKKGVDWFDLKRWKELIKHYRGGPVIDIGVLDSLALIMLRKKYPFEFMLGIDIAEYAIKTMRVVYPSIYWEEYDANNIPIKDNAVNYVIMGELIEHVESPGKVIKEAMRILKSGGILALSTPLEETEKGEFDKEHHLWSFSIEDIINLLSPYGTVKIKLLGSNYFPIYKYHPKAILAWCQKR